MTKKSSMDTYKQEVEKNPVFHDHNSAHVFTRGPLLGKGGFGFVYETTMPGYTRRLVLKAIPKARVTKVTQRQRIDNEIKLHSKLKHINVVDLYHSFEEDHVICMIIERCERSLLDLLQEQNRKVKTEDVSIVARQSLLALDYLHTNNVIHRDLKLGNILLKNQLLVKVCDFGLAKYYNPSDKPTICGTPNYLAPEVLQHKGHRPISDVWSLGCVLVVLLCGRAPFEGDTTEETYELIVNSPLKIPGSVTPETEEFLEALLTKEHDNRTSVDEALLFKFITDSEHIPAQTIPDEEPMTAIWPSQINKLKNTKQNLKNSPKNQENSKNQESTHRNPLSELLHQSGSRQTSSNYNLNQVFEDEEVEKSVEEVNAKILDQQRWDRLVDCSDKFTVQDVEQGKCSIFYDASTDDENGFQLWIQCWIDYTNKDCGFAYRLSNDTVGVKLKTDKISYVLKRTIDRVEGNFKYEYYSESRNKLISFKDLSELEKTRNDDRFKKHVGEMQHLVDYYDNYMQSNLINAGNMPNVGENDVCKVRLLGWNKNRQCVAMVLSNYTLQVNYFQSHIKLVIQGQFDQPYGFKMPIPQTPSKPSIKKDMSVIAMSKYDKKQEFKIMFVNSKRRCFRLNTSLVLYLLANGPKSVHPNCTKVLGIEPDELYEAFRQAHQAMHRLTTFSDQCYSESLICNALSGKPHQPQPNHTLHQEYPVQQNNNCSHANSSNHLISSQKPTLTPTAVVNSNKHTALITPLARRNVNQVKGVNQ